MENNCQENKKNNFQVFRFKIDNELVELISRFSMEHQFDNRHDFKEAWGKWKEIHQEYIDKEEQRILKLNYKGNIEQKLYKAARYYYRSKYRLEKDSEDEYEKECENENKLDIKRDYITLQNEFLSEIDKHIGSNIKNSDYTPASGYEDFCKNNVDLIKKEIEDLLNLRNDLGVDFIIKKIKKAYKNRYYQYKKFN